MPIESPVSGKRQPRRPRVVAPVADSPPPDPRVAEGELARILEFCHSAGPKEWRRVTTVPGSVACFDPLNRAVWKLRRALAELGAAFVKKHGSKLISERRFILAPAELGRLEVLLNGSHQGDAQSVLALAIMVQGEPLAFPPGASEALWNAVIMPAIETAGVELGRLIG